MRFQQAYGLAAKVHRLEASYLSHYMLGASLERLGRIDESVVQDWLPRWFDEGYASYAAAEWSRDEVLAGFPPVVDRALATGVRDLGSLVAATAVASAVRPSTMNALRTRLPALLRHQFSSVPGSSGLGLAGSSGLTGSSSRSSPASNSPRMSAACLFNSLRARPTASWMSRSRSSERLGSSPFSEGLKGLRFDAAAARHDSD